MGSRRGKGKGSVYKDAQGRWVAAVPLPSDPATGRRRRKVFRARSKIEALRKMRETQNELARTGNVSTNRPVTVAEWMGQWIDQDIAPMRKPATTADYRSLTTRTSSQPSVAAGSTASPPATSEPSTATSLSQAGPPPPPPKSTESCAPHSRLLSVREWRPGTWRVW